MPFSLASTAWSAVQVHEPSLFILGSITCASAAAPSSPMRFPPTARPRSARFATQYPSPRGAATGCWVHTPWHVPHAQSSPPTPVHTSSSTTVGTASPLATATPKLDLRDAVWEGPAELGLDTARPLLGLERGLMNPPRPLALDGLLPYGVAPGDDAALLFGDPPEFMLSPGGYASIVVTGEDRPDSSPGTGPAHHRGVKALATAQIPSGPASLNSRFNTASPPPPGTHRVRRSEPLALPPRELGPWTFPWAPPWAKNAFALNAPGVDDPEFGDCVPKSTSTGTGSSIAAIASMPSAPIWLSRKSRMRSAVLNAHCDSILTSAKKSLLRCGVSALANALAPPGPIVAPPRCSSRSLGLNSQRPHAPPVPSCASGDQRGRSASAT